MTDQRIKVSQDSLGAGGEDSWVAQKGSKLGYSIVMDFYTQMAIEGRVFNNRAGTIATPFVGDVPVADTAAELSVDAALGTTIIPAYCSIGITLQPGTANIYKISSVGAVSTGGDVVVLQNLLIGGTGALATARADAVGGVTVAAELITTTRLHFAYGNGIVMGAYNGSCEWRPVAPPVLVGPASIYVQIGATGTGPSYFMGMEVIELPTANIS